MKLRSINTEDDRILSEIIRRELERVHLDIPGTAYFDESLDHLSKYYLAEKEKRFYYVITDDEDRVLGGAGIAECVFFDRCCELQKLYLKEDARGEGLGYRLLRAVEEKAAELKYERIYLETHSVLQAALHLYEKSGYLEIERPEVIVHTTMDHFFIKDLV